MKIEALARKYRIDNPDKFRLADVDPGDTAGLAIDKDEAKAMLQDSIQKLSDLQEMLYAQDRWSVLAIFQAMDAAGKDSAIEHVMSGVNPQGCQVYSFKAPTSHELDHDYMWRTTIATPERGRIGIFNRSYYEEVLVVRAHPELLAKQKIPPQLVTKDIWKQRFEDIRNFEKYQARNGLLIMKFFLHMSKDEQAKRFLERIDDPAKNWKFNMGDVAERKLWDKYMEAYEDAIRETSRPEAPWYIVPADNKWFARLVIAEAMVEAMESLDLAFPKVENSSLKELERVRGALMAEAPKKRGK
jgi:PPK2 family polyphosphate:nucleotide phosphotransferase